MNVIVAGGSGLIGQYLTRFLAGRGDQVWVLTRNPAEAQLPEGVKAVGWDGRTPSGWGSLVSGADAVIHLAGANIGARPWTNARKQLIRSSRVEAGQAIVEAIRQSEKKPRALIQTAGVGYYGVHGDETLDEQSPAGQDYLAGVVVDWENATAPVESLGVRRVIMRTGVVLAPKSGVLAPFVFQNQVFAGGPLGSGRQWISWIHIHDLVRAFAFLLDSASQSDAARSDTAQGVFNVTAPDPVTNATFERAVSKIMHRPYWLPAPAFLLRLLLGEMSTVVLEGQRVLPKRLLEMGFHFDFDTLQKALEDLLGQHAPNPV